MDLGLPVAYLLFAFGTVQLMFGLIFIAGHAWKKNPVLGIFTALLPFIVGIFWSIGPYKNDKEAPLKELRIVLFFSGMITMFMSAVLIIALWGYVTTVSALY